MNQKGLTDIAISQAVLRHIPNAKNILKKMIQSVVEDGLIICMEGDMEIEKAGRYFSGFDYTELDLPHLYRKMYKKELSNGEEIIDLLLKFLYLCKN